MLKLTLSVPPLHFEMANGEIVHFCTCIYVPHIPSTGEGFVSIRNPGGKMLTMMNSQKIHQILYPGSQITVSFTTLWHCSHRANVISLKKKNQFSFLRKRMFRAPLVSEGRQKSLCACPASCALMLILTTGLVISCVYLYIDTYIFFSPRSCFEIYAWILNEEQLRDEENGLRIQQAVSYLDLK